jgi:hypothetical protein
MYIWHNRDNVTLQNNCRRLWFQRPVWEESYTDLENETCFLNSLITLRDDTARQKNVYRNQWYQWIISDMYVIHVTGHFCIHSRHICHNWLLHTFTTYMSNAHYYVQNIFKTNQNRRECGEEPHRLVQTNTRYISAKRSLYSLYICHTFTFAYTHYISFTCSLFHIYVLHIFKKFTRAKGNKIQGYQCLHKTVPNHNNHIRIIPIVPNSCRHITLLDNNVYINMMFYDTLCPQKTFNTLTLQAWFVTTKQPKNCHQGKMWFVYFSESDHTFIYIFYMSNGIKYSKQKSHSTV